MRLPLLILTALLLVSPRAGLGADHGNPVLVCAFGIPGAPFHEADSSSPYGWKGLFVDILDRVLVRELGVDLTFMAFPWKRAQKQVEDGNADILISVPTSERLQYSLASDAPVLKMYLHVYTYAGHRRLPEIRQIRTPADIIALNLIPATNDGNSWHKENIDSFGVKTLYVPNDENLVQFLAKRRADIMIDAPITMNRLIRQYGLAADIVQTDVRFGPVNFHLLMSRKSRYVKLMPEINAAISKLAKDGTLEKLAMNYVLPD
jgi:polar amino acid transport system substrate-binding protein